MQDNMNYTTPVSAATVEDRSEFIWRTYAHVVGGILAFAAIEAFLFTSGPRRQTVPDPDVELADHDWRPDARELAGVPNGAHA